MFFVENVDAPLADYRRKAVESKVTAVVGQDRPALQNYMLGNLETCPQIDLQAMQASAATNAQYLTAASSTKEKKHEKSIDLGSSSSTAALPTNSSEQENKELKRAQKRKAETIGEPIVEIVDKEFLESVEKDKAIMQKFRSNFYTPLNAGNIMNAIHSVRLLTYICEISNSI